MDSMTIIAYLIFGSPVIYIIYLIVRFIVDFFADRVNEIKRHIYLGEKEIIYATTYQNDNITKDDIMRLFKSQVERYAQKYFFIDNNIYDDKDKQYYAWSVKTTKQTYGWGIVYNIRFHFSNGWINVKFSNSYFSCGGESSRGYYSSIILEQALDSCWEESRIKWKLYGRKPENDLPFNFYSMTAGLKGKQKKFDSYKSSESHNENSSGTDLFSFYRSLLGLKLHFSQAELKNAYRKAVVKYHPDHYGASSPRDRENAETLMKQINEAYENLKKTA